MKSARLLSMLLLLQARPQMTTRDLAERLEVSRRTVLRDVEALSAAGVPVYAERGRNGGIVLLTGARLNVSHLDPGELETLAIGGLDSTQLEQLNLSAAAQQAFRKIAAHQHRSSARANPVPLRDLILIENTSWMSRPDHVVDIADLAVDLQQGKRLRITYRHSNADHPVQYLVDPYGVVAKSTRWYLIADHGGQPCMYALGRLLSYEVTKDPVVTRPGNTLRTVWSSLKESVEAPGEITITARLRTSRLDLAHRILGTRLQESIPVDQEWSQVAIQYKEIEAVRQLLQFADHIEVLAPAAARQRLHELAEDLVKRHAQSRA
ncbi:WYL domain-containing protein [Yaniella flava]|uniref:WYL domain-containing protein n=1 Tax=Yaniella flava TaxID=287930 RepID=A0ABP5FK98_9MICC